MHGFDRISKPWSIQWRGGTDIFTHECSRKWGLRETIACAESKNEWPKIRAESDGALSF